jgi:uncharacterized repeat protein (TIGR02543 family)
MIKRIAKFIILISSLFLLASCSFLINNEKNLKKLNQELGIEKYDDIKEDNYTITYELDGGTNSNSNPSKYNSDDSVIKLENPERKGYDLEGWYLESQFRTKISEIKPSERKDYTLYAKWKIIEYSITYILNGGTNSSMNPKSYNIENNGITFYEPSREDYKFDGWFKDSDFKETITGIEAHSTGEISIYAKWIRKTESLIIFNQDTGKIQINIECIEGNQVKVSASEGYKIYKWIYDDIVLSDNSNLITIDINEPGYHYITVFAFDESGFSYSAQCNIRRKDTAYSSSTEEENPDEQPNTYITVIPLINDTDDLSISTATNDGSMIFTATEGFDSYSWLIDEELQEETTNSLTKKYFSVGYHIITVICKKNDNTYSNSITIRKTVGESSTEKTTGSIETILLSNDITSLPISISANSTKYTFSVDTGYSSYNWYVDDTVLLNESNSIILNNLSEGYHYISVVACNDKGEIISSTCTIRVINESSSSSSEESNTEGKSSSKVTVLSLNNDTEAISIEASYSSNVINLTTSSNYSSYTWILDNEVMESTTNELSLTNITKGYHLITVTARESDGKTVSTYIQIRVTN